MTTIKRQCWCFYVEGREERLLRATVDVDAIAKHMTEGEFDVYDEVAKACRPAAEASVTPRVKRTWLHDNAERIKDAGAEPEDAYSAWLAGRTDTFIRTIEGEVVDVMSNIVFED